jgi:hypothetical protein
MHRIVPILRRGVLFLALLTLVVTGLGSSSSPPPLDIRQKARAFTRHIEFDYVGWTLDALRVKFLEFSVGASNFLPDDKRRRLVFEYLELVRQIQNTEGQIRMIYADPGVADPQAVSQPARRMLQELRAQYKQTAPLAEAVLQDQINTVVSELGLDIGGQAFPPVLYHSSPLPMALIISPRQVIRQEADISLIPDLPIDQQIALEERVDRALNVSSLVVNIGGVGVYPTMVMQTSDLNWLSEVVAHEWVHNYLTLRPLGMNYLESPELRIMNETAASIAGKEIGWAVIERYYPELLPPPPQAAPRQDEASPEEPPVFDFRKEMHLTRITVDQLLSEGKVEQAEAYMEARRKIFWDHGYRGLRKLNQAYFAFYGAYADEPLGPAGEDPIGAAVRKLRAQSPTLAAFLQKIAWMTTFEDLLRAVGEGN